jgi:D-alanyl-D-alanine carboxypeptidase
LLVQGVLSGEKKVQANVSGNEISIQGLVRGVEAAKVQEPVKPKPKAQAVDNPQYQPVRQEGVKDLVIPGAHASVIIDADTGTILHYNEGRAERQIASLTKLMTAVLVMEKVKNLNEEVIIDEEAIYADGTKVGCPRSGVCDKQRLRIGEKVSVKNLLRAALLNSANDAAIALGKHVGGSQEAFAGMMNEKAKELGLTDTNFCTPSGLEPDGRESECYSSAYDIARIAAYSLRYDEIWKIFKFSSEPEIIKITSADGKTEHEILNTISNLGQIPNALGGKTGFTPLAGYSLLAVVADPSMKHRIVAVVLDDITRWQDIKTMTDWTFNSYDWK